MGKECKTAGGHREGSLCGERWCQFEEKNWKQEDIRADVEIKTEGKRARGRTKLRGRTQRQRLYGHGR